MSLSGQFCLAVVAMLIVSVATAEPGRYGLGTPVTPEEISGWDIDVRPDGQGLPVGKGSVEQGEGLYEAQCAECHGSFGEAVGRYPALAGGEGSLRDDRPHKTVGSYWAHVTTLWDYIHRAMPYTRPESLSDDEVYALTAYVLYLNELVEDDFVLDRQTIHEVVLPNRLNFTPDMRPDTSNTRCMADCKPLNSIKITSMVQPLTSTIQNTALNNKPVAQALGPQTYRQACALCHDGGIGGAPEIGDVTVWRTRAAQGRAVLDANAISGFQGEQGIMPPKGGFLGLSDAAVTAAVSYMLEQSQ